MNSTAQTVNRLEELPDFFSPAELSRILGISKSTAYRRAEEGKIPSLRIGNRVIISRTHLLRWLDQEILGG